MAFDIVEAAQALVRGHRDNTRFATIQGLSDLASVACDGGALWSI
ncbi:hypothetical protein MPLSOD_10512 [Mesorhizobium sp. SOD10]|nr:hypothetical protein MPLSOD_10512 [Mesorhizobium sp. SOD10]